MAYNVKQRARPYGGRATPRLAAWQAKDTALQQRGASARSYLSLDTQPGGQLDEVRRRLQACLVPTIPAEADTGELIAVYDDCYRRLWTYLAQIIGHKGVAAVWGRALFILTPGLPLAGLVEVRAEALSLERLGTAEAADAAALRVLLAELFVSFIDVLCSLIGWHLTQSTLDRVECAPRG
jgi:hypothetical protein